MRLTEVKSFNLTLNYAELNSLVLVAYCTGEDEYKEFASRQNNAIPGNILPWEEVMELVKTLDSVKYD